MSNTWKNFPRINAVRISNEAQMEEPEYTTNDYVNAFKNIMVAPHHMRMLQAHYHQPDHIITATQMSKILGYPTYNAANLHYGKLGRLIGEELGWSPMPKQNIFVLVTFNKPEHEWHWILRNEVAGTLELLGWVETEYSQSPDEVEVAKSYYEGALRRVSVNAYERNSGAREKCILHYGCRCVTCGAMLSEKYGEPAQGLIHVHHLRQLSEINSEYHVDPIEDLRPVCPTCHAVIHSRKPPYTIAEVVIMIETQRKS
jgi:predicted HNH restriction endonuclease